MKVFSFLFAVLLLSCSSSKNVSTTSSQAAYSVGAPAVFIMDGNVLKEKRGRVNAKDKTLMPAYQKLLREADKALQEPPHSVMEKKNNPPSGDKHDYMSLAPYFWPDPTKKDGLPYIRKDGQTNPEVKDYKDKEYMPQLCEDVETLALAYYFSDNEKYAAQAEKMLEVWFLNADTKMNPNLNYAQAIKGVNTGRGAGLIDARHFMKVIDAVGLLQGSKAWTEADQKGTQQWFSNFLNWMQTSEVGKDELDAPNNHGDWYDALRLSISLFTGNNEAAKAIVESAKKRLDKQMDPEGKFPKEMERTIALHYNIFALQAFYNIASMSEKIGVDFWNYSSPSGASLQKAFNYFYPYITKKKEWTAQQIKPWDFGEGYPILLTNAQKYGCKTCRDDVQQLAGEDKERLRENLIY